jgi:hypothetical protein
MNIGKIYTLNDNTKDLIKKQSTKTQQACISGLFYVKNENGFCRTHSPYSVDILIVPLEVFNTSYTGIYLKSNVRRVKALFPDGRIGMLFVDLNEWEQVTT